MDGYEPVTTFDESNAAVYDSLAVRGDEEEAVAFLVSVAGEGPALELAIGTGRIALPLASTGLHVDGVDLSQPMVDQLRSKPGGGALQVTIGDFCDVELDDRYRLIYVVFNSFSNVITQDDQVRAFENVARHLTDDGVFVMEMYLPSVHVGLRNDQYVEAEAIGVDEVRLDLLKYDGSTQILEENHVTLSTTGIRFNPVVQRAVWPSELDLMARIAGLRLHARHGGWQQEPFTRKSELHVSVWGR
jgi:SAM-dependent methyltransferase